MSFEIFFNAYEHGEPSGFPLAAVEAVFRTAIVHREFTGDGFFWRLEYPVPASSGYPVGVRDGSEVYGSLRDLESPQPTTDGFMIKGPAAHDDFYVALLRLLQTTHSALFWPGDGALVIGRPESAEHLPDDMIETLGEPFLAREPSQIVDRIRSS